ncbi:MAG: tripartite tricarboxylate transporter permease [Alphaproteobacteria bacterium]|nr:tripartite tricarboxylate transporter permease [Alphaproteobacteria bacterium]
MDLFANLALGFGVAFSLDNLLYCLVGVTLGTMIGILPGIGPIVTISVLLPLTYGLTPAGALIMLAGIYYGAQYGGSTTAILVNMPGEASSVVTCIDGYRMARQGRAGPALAIAAIGSLVAGVIGTLLLAILGPQLAEFALSFSAPEYFALALMAMVGASALVRGSAIKGGLMALTGILIGLVGIDVSSGVPRFTFGFQPLMEGIDFAIVAMGLFAIAEILSLLEKAEGRSVTEIEVKGVMPSGADLRASTAPILRGTAVGSFFGVLPGAGAATSAFAAYMLEKRFGRAGERLGTGAIEGVAAPESANNAAAQTAFIPTLTLGVPGSGTMALMMGAMMIHGIQPGPQVMSRYPELFWGLAVSMLVGNVMLVVLNLPLIRFWVMLLRVPYRVLYPAILVFSCVGIYSLNRSVVDVGLAAMFGLVGYAFIKLEFEPAPLVLGLVLGPMLEENFRRALVISHGDPTILFTRPISAAFMALTALMLVVMLLPAVQRGKRAAIQDDAT